MEGTKKTDETCLSLIMLAHQNDGESFLQFSRLRHGELQRQVVSPEISVLVHAPRVPHVCSAALYDQHLQLSSTSARNNEKDPFAFCPRGLLTGCSWRGSSLQHKAHVREAA